MKEVNTMKTKEYLVTFKNNETLETIDMFYINANDIIEARQIADELRHEYNDVNYFDLLAIVEQA